MKTEKVIQSEINETRLHLRAKEEVWEEYPAKSQLECDIRNEERLKLQHRIHALEWVVSP
jgi:hypothetical protein